MPDERASSYSSILVLEPKTQAVGVVETQSSVILLGGHGILLDISRFTLSMSLPVQAGNPPFDIFIRFAQGNLVFAISKEQGLPLCSLGILFAFSQVCFDDQT